nr:helix-turn-helix transcriptional regulator [Clostridia bacterium]
MSDTEIKVIRSATKLFLTQGFSKTTHRQIADESGIGLGTITYHYKVKEDLLRVLFEELMDFH